ncbi:hypothetical protein ACVOMV_00015 [Mesorhizobium atlanticum]
MRSQIIKRMVTMANIPDVASRIVENQLRASVPVSESQQGHHGRGGNASRACSTRSRSRNWTT